MTALAKPYTQGVSTVTLNRILILFGAIGLFVASVLSSETLLHKTIPCTAGGGCAAVAHSEYSKFMGTPVAYFGFVGYLILTAIAVTRGMTGKYDSRLFTIGGYGFSAVGMIASIYLQYISFTVIGQKCAWCIASAIDMILTFVVYTLMFSRLGVEELAEPPAKDVRVLFQGLAAVMLAMVAASVVIFRSPESNAIVLKDEVVSRLVPEPRSLRNQLGPDDAPVTLIEYADLCCPQCREAFPKIHELIGKYPGRIRIVYRHFPIFNLPGHEMSTYAIMASEIAAQKGKFWQFADAFVAPQEAPRTQEGVNEIAQTVGVTAAEIVAASQDTSSQPNMNLARDFKEALEVFDIKSTPTFMLYVKGKPVKKMLLMGMLAELETPEYQSLLKP